MSNKLDLIAVVGEYTDAQGNNKKRFSKIGTLWDKGQQGISLKIDHIPVNWDGWLSAKPPLEPRATPQQKAPVFIDEDAPF
jgi:hypothetical protein